MSIRFRLLVLVLSALLPAVLVSIWLVTQTYRGERQLLQSGLRDTARALSWVVDRELTRRADIARVLSTAGLFDAGGSLGEEERSSFIGRAEGALGDLDSWLELRSADTPVLSTRQPPAEKPVTPASPASSVSSVSTVAPLLETATVLPLHDTGDGLGLRAAVVQPVQREGRTLYNLSVLVLPQELQTLIDRQALPSEAVATIIDSNGRVVARHPGGAEYVGRPATPDMIERFSKVDEGLFESVSLNGVPMFGYYATSPQGWVYLTALPSPTLGDTLASPVAKMALAATLLLALAVVAALWVARRIARPVVSLKSQAIRMRNAQIVQPSPAGITEIDEVAQAMAQTAAALRDSRADLERQVSVAVEQTRNAEHRNSQSQRVEALGRLTGGVAHDFNNVLGIISNSAHLMQRRTTLPELQAPLAATLRAVEVGSRLTQHLMRFAGRQPVRASPLDLARYLNESLELLEIVLGKRVELSLRCEPGLPNVTVDVSELELTLINLALNARDAMPDGGKAGLHARVAEAAETAELPPGRYVLLGLTDTGKGIESGVLEHVFEPFFTTKAAGKGTGLGLSQVHGFCQQAGGTVSIASVPGRGTTVALILPATDQSVLAPATEHPAHDASALDARRVLLVEDNVELGDATAQLLESFGCQVERASSAQQALLRVAEDSAFDIVLSDVAMPGEMDGLAMARLLRSQYPQLAIVLISGYSSALTEARDFAVLSKPCAPADLLVALQSAIEASAAKVPGPLPG